ncbi:1790_t:CDS:1 [Funneliformis geosporum]|uniref:1790_t:CDS:1 n=1 Tax=Funneliformis geosporum TaxID=1117311 RepID=A0A9W4SZ88_9GLOM|nr:1790_t:CDS:1 [Funneliformis geosporum]
MVLEYAPNGTLRDYIQKNIGTLDWKRKSLILQGIASGLRTIHSANLIHGNIHTGNILQENLRSNIGDFKFATKYHAKKKPSSSLPTAANASLSEVYGVMPFIAPEILRGQQTTLSSDIYSFGMIMWELSSLNLPFYDKPHDAQLIMELCGGSRPEIVIETPDAYVSLMKRCWHSDPSKRPTAEELVYITDELSSSMSYKKIGLPEKVLLENSMMESLKNIHPSAVYSSRLLLTLYAIHNQDDNEGIYHFNKIPFL